MLQMFRNFACKQYSWQTNFCLSRVRSDFSLLHAHQGAGNSRKFGHFSFFTTFLRFPHSETTSIGLRIISSTFLDLFWNFEKKKNFGKFSHLALFGTFWPKLPKYALLGLKSLGFARAFISRDKIWRFLPGTPFSYFFGTFCNFLATLCKTACFFLPSSHER